MAQPIFPFATRIEGPVHQDRDGRVRPALSQRIRPAETPLIECTADLKKLIANTAVQFSESFEIDGPDMFKLAYGIGLEGVVSKVGDSIIRPAGRMIWSKKTAPSARR
jgi:ATP-dependent DNA ligase